MGMLLQVVIKTILITSHYFTSYVIQMISNYKNLETLINMLEFSLDESSTLHSELRPGINKRGNRWWGKQRTLLIKTPTNTWGLRNTNRAQGNEKLSREFQRRLKSTLKMTLDRKKLNMSDKRLCYFQSHVLIWHRTYRGRNENLEVSRDLYELRQRTGCYNLISAQK
jgi:hypothetical protein